MWGCVFLLCCCRSERQSYLRSGTDLLFQKHMYTAGSVRSRDPSHRTKKPLHGCCTVSVWEHDDKRHFFFSPSLLDVTWCRSKGAWHWTSQDWNVYLWQECQEKTVMLSQQLLTPTYRRMHTLTPHLWWFKPCPLEDVKRGLSTTEELRKTGLFEITPTERMHTCVNTTQTDTQRHC